MRKRATTMVTFSPESKNGQKVKGIMKRNTETHNAAEMAQLRKENNELSLIVNESVELAEMYKAELLTLQEKQNTDEIHHSTFARVLFPYQPRDEHELALVKNTIVEFTSNLDSDGFYVGHDQSGASGLIPSNYVTMLPTTQTNTVSVVVALEPMDNDNAKLTIKTHKLNGFTVAWYQIRHF